MAYSLRGSNLSHKKTDSNFGFVWDNHVINGKVWIVVPENFFDMTSRSFLDNNSVRDSLCMIFFEKNNAHISGLTWLTKVLLIL